MAKKFNALGKKQAKNKKYNCVGKLNKNQTYNEKIN